MVKTVRNDQIPFRTAPKLPAVSSKGSENPQILAEVKISVHLSGYHKCDQPLRQLTCQVKADIHVLSSETTRQDDRHMGGKDSTRTTS